jgi:hypothetical protein
MIIGPRSSLQSSGLFAMQVSQRMLAGAGGDLDTLVDTVANLSLAKATLAIGVKLIEADQELFESTLDIFA